MDSSSLIVAGGGIAGLGAALALGQHDVVVLEQAKMLTGAGAGLQLGPNAVKALQKLGAWDAVSPSTSSPPEIHMRDGISGKLLKRLPLGDHFESLFGGPYRVAHRADLHAALLSVVKTRPHVDVRTNQLVTAIHANPIDVILDTPSGRISTQALIATDGVKSIIRQSLFPESQTVDAGVTFHRALWPVSDCAGVDMACVNLWMYPGGHVVHYPVGKSQQLNLVAIVPQTKAVDSFFARACPALQQIVQEAIPHMTPWPGLYAPALPHWAKQGVLLLGDAAHGTLPYLAQGAAMALEDAACLSGALQTTQSFNHAFAETAARRRNRTTKLHQASLAAGRTYHHSGLMRMARNFAIVNMPTGFLQSRLEWIYKT
jgi:salicylate hydroxylase